MSGIETTEHSDGPRVALVGASSLLGTEIKRQLGDSGFPGSALSLLDLDEVAGVLTEYGDEARVLAEAVSEDILGHDVVCFCGDPATASEHFEAVRREGRVGIDCTGASAGRDDVFLWLPGVSPPPTLHDNPFNAMPSAGTLLLGSIIDALGETGARAAATLLLALVGGALLTWLGVPAGWLAGGMLFVAAASLGGLETEVPDRIRWIFFLFLGIFAGSGASPETLQQIALWPASFAGVLWSPVTISTLGPRASTLGTTASNSSIIFTLASKSPSSPRLSVYLKWTKKKS